MIEVLNLLWPEIETSWGGIIKSSHGGVSNLDIEKQFQWEELRGSHVLEIIFRDESREKFTLGEFDFFICNESESEFIHICHESDIHFDLNEALSKTIGIALRSIGIPSEDE